MNEEKIRDITTEIFDKLMYNDEEVADKYDDMMSFVEYVLEHKKAPLRLVDNCGLTDTEFGMAMMTIKNCLKENKMDFEKIYKLDERRDDYNVTYAKTGDLDSVEDPDTNKFKQGTNKKPAIKGLPNFEYNNAKWKGPPTTGVGRKDYNVTYAKRDLLEGIIDPKDRDLLNEGYEHMIAEMDPYSKNCFICERCGCNHDDDGTDEEACLCPECYGNDIDNLDRDDYVDENDPWDGWDVDDELYESMPTHTKSGKLIERRVKGKASPALQESAKRYQDKKRLIENKIIDKADLDLLEESEKCSKCGAVQTKKNADYSCWGDGICPKCSRKKVKESYEDDMDTFRPEAEQLADELGLDFDSVLEIMNSVSSVEDAAERICDEYQLDMADCDVVNDILGIEGERNRDHLDDFGISIDEYNEYLSDERKYTPPSITQEMRDHDMMTDEQYEKWFEENNDGDRR